MSVQLLLSQERTVDLGPTIPFLKAFAEWDEVYGPGFFDDFPDLGGIVTQVERNTVADDDWYIDACKEADDFLDRYGDELSESATEVLRAISVPVANYSDEQPRDAHGRWGSGAVTAAKAAIATLKKHVDAVTSVQGLKQVRQATEACGKVSKAMYSAMESRYGRPAAIAITASAQVIGWGALGVGAAIGVPLYLPGVSIWGSIPAAAVAETFLQASRGVRALTGNAEGLSQAEVEALAHEFVQHVEFEFLDYLRRNPPSEEA